MPKIAANAKIQTQPKQSFDSPESLLEFLNQPSFFFICLIRSLIRLCIDLLRLIPEYQVYQARGDQPS